LSEILEDIKRRPSKEEIQRKLGPKGEVEKRTEQREVAELKRLSQILSERKGKPVLNSVYVESLDCKIEFGDPTVGEFFNILKTARTTGNMDVFVFDLMSVMLRKADPDLTPDALNSKIEAVEAIDLLAEIMDASPFFKKAFSLRTSGKFSLV